MRKIKALLLLAVPVLLLSCNQGANRKSNDTNDDVRENREYRDSRERRDTVIRDMDNMEDRGINQGVDRDTINQDL